MIRRRRAARAAPLAQGSDRAHYRVFVKLPCVIIMNNIFIHSNLKKNIFFYYKRLLVIGYMNWAAFLKRPKSHGVYVINIYNTIAVKPKSYLI